jgi:hypothetical protein
MTTGGGVQGEGGGGGGGSSEHCTIGGVKFDQERLETTQQCHEVVINSSNIATQYSTFHVMLKHAVIPNHAIVCASLLQVCVSGLQWLID